MSHKFNQTTQHVLEALLGILGKVREIDDWDFLAQQFPDLEKGCEAVQRAYNLVKKESD